MAMSNRQAFASAVLLSLLVCGLGAIFFLPGPDDAVKTGTHLQPQGPLPVKRAEGDSSMISTQSQLSVVYTPWTKICGKDPRQTDARDECLVTKEVRLDSGEFVAAAVLTEGSEGSSKALRIVFPLGMRLQSGTRVVFDDDAPVDRPYRTCIAKGCIADYGADSELLLKLRTAGQLRIEGVNSLGQSLGFALSLADFAEAYDGPPTDLKTFEERKSQLTSQQH